MRYHEQDATDRAVIALIDRMSSEDLAGFDRVRPRNLGHYLAVQKPWIEDEIYFLGIHLERAPTAQEIAEVILKQSHSQRFRAYFALRFPESVLPA